VAAPKFSIIEPPTQGEPIAVSSDGALEVPDHPVLCFIEGDGTGPDIWRASQPVFDAAVERAYGGRRRIAWCEVYGGEKAHRGFGDWLPEETLRAIEHFHVAIKCPLTTPIGGGIRSLNVALRQRLELYACVRPVRHFPGVPSPAAHPELLDVVIFRENMEDVYAGIEWAQGSKEAAEFIRFLRERMNVNIADDSGVGVKPISVKNSKRLIRRAIRYALERGRESVTLMHKGNIMKFTEGAFRQWGYELAKEEFGDCTVAEADLDGELPQDRVVIKDRIADIMFQHLLLRPGEFDVIATPNLNGDYISDAAAAQVGGMGLAPGANIGDRAAIFEATHGTAPRYAGQDVVNPSALILSGVMMFEHLGWNGASELITSGLGRAIAEKTVTYDLHRQMEGATKVRCSEFGELIIRNMP
jgi:isocitrate dehydrogenase